MEVTVATFTRNSGDPVVFARAGLAGAKYMWECEKLYRPHRNPYVTTTSTTCSTLCTCMSRSYMYRYMYIGGFSFNRTTPLST